MILPGARYQEHGWERVKALLSDAGCAALSARECTAFGLNDPEADCAAFVCWVGESLARAARSSDRNQAANHYGDPALSLASELLLECGAFPQLFLRHSNKLRGLPPVGASGRGARSRQLLEQYFAELRDEVDAREIGATTGQPWSANRLWVYRKVDETWHELVRFFEQKLNEAARTQAESILQRPLQIGTVPIEVARMKRRRSCDPNWIIRWSEFHRGWLHNTNRAEGWHARPDRIAAVLAELAAGEELHAPGVRADGDRNDLGGEDDWLGDLDRVIDESKRSDPDGDEAGNPVLEDLIVRDPWSEEALADGEDDPDGETGSVEPSAAQAREADTARLARAGGVTAEESPLPSVAPPRDGEHEIALGLPPGYMRMAVAAEDQGSELFAALSSHCSIWIRMQLYRQLVGPTDPDYPDGWRLPSTRALPTQAQLAGLEGVSVPTFMRRVKLALVTLRASALGLGRHQR